ncbi:MAG: M28 family peptidase [Gemmatimonadetes bacterium]|nr:M28 family peptidase [Gemmatimonadota bacterium]
MNNSTYDLDSQLPRRWVHTLAGEIGIRLAGTAGERQAADFIEEEFGRIFPEVRRHEYRFLGWRPGDEGMLEINGETHATRLGIACPSTPEGGVSGRLRPMGPSIYGIWEEGAAGPAAHIMAYSGHSECAIPLLWNPYASIPAGIVGGGMRDRLQAAERDGEKVTFSCRTEFLPGCPSWNVEGIIPGDRGRHVIVVAHYDTVYVSPGANDNAASAACLPALGQLLMEMSGRNCPTLHFLATGGEEIDLQGARCYVRDLVWKGEGGQVVLALNFDSLTWGNQVKVGVAPPAEAMLPILDEAFAAVQLSVYHGSYEREGLYGGVDSAPFHQAGLPTLNINTAGDAETTALWHTPEDTENRVVWSRVDDGITLFSEFFARLK